MKNFSVSPPSDSVGALLTKAAVIWGIALLSRAALNHVAIWMVDLLIKEALAEITLGIAVAFLV